MKRFKKVRMHKRKVANCKKSHYNVSIPLTQARCLVYNTLSQSFCLLNAQETIFFQNETFRLKPNSQSKENKLVKNLLAQGLIVPNNIAELNIIENQYEEARNSEQVLMLTIAPTISCNFGCDYCFQDHIKSSMPEEVQDAICKFVEYTAYTKPEKFKQLHVCFYGGEPLIKFDIIKNLAKRFSTFCKAKGIVYTAEIVTNGYLLTLDRAKTLYEYGVSKCQITLDGPEEIHDVRRHLVSKRGTFKTILHNIKAYIDEVPIFTNIRVNIDQRNANDISRLLDYLVESELNGKNLQVYFAPVESLTAACKNIADLTLEKSHISKVLFELYVEAVEKNLHSIVMPPRMLGLCTASRKNAFVIAPNGDLHKCFDTVTSSLFNVGSILDYKDIFTAKEFQEKVQKWDSFSLFKNEVCRDCVLLPNCVGFCPYKFIYGSYVNGKSILPCPEWKSNIKEKLVFQALKSNIITREDYDEHEISTDPMQLSLSHRKHTIESMLENQM